MQQALTVMGLSDDERQNLLKTVAGVLHFGNCAFAQSRRSEFADTIANTEIEKVAHLFGLNVQDLSKALLKPRIKVGNEYTVQGRTVDQVCVFEELQFIK